MKDGASRVRRREEAREAEGSAGGGCSLKRKSRHSGKFWFSDPKVRPDPELGTHVHMSPRGLAAFRQVLVQRSNGTA